MRKKIIAVMFIAIVMVGITGCSNYIYDVKGEKQVSGKLECVDGTYSCSEWIDTETGVHYFFTPEGGLILRVNADGSPYEGE